MPDHNNQYHCFLAGKTCSGFVKKLASLHVNGCSRSKPLAYWSTVQSVLHPRLFFSWSTHASINICSQMFAQCKQLNLSVRIHKEFKWAISSPKIIILLIAKSIGLTVLSACAPIDVDKTTGCDCYKQLINWLYKGVHAPADAEDGLNHTLKQITFIIFCP